MLSLLETHTTLLLVILSYLCRERVVFSSCWPCVWKPHSETATCCGYDWARSVAGSSWLHAMIAIMVARSRFKYEWYKCGCDVHGFPCRLSLTSLCWGRAVGNMFDPCLPCLYPHRHLRPHYNFANRWYGEPIWGNDICQPNSWCSRRDWWPRWCLERSCWIHHGTRAMQKWFSRVLITQVLITYRRNDFASVRACFELDGCRDARYVCPPNIMIWSEANRNI